MSLRLRAAAALILFSSSPLLAERYAVLVGISKYQNGIHPLDGPVYDVAAVRDTLLRSGYNSQSITVLLNEEGTRPKIVAALKSAVGRLKAGDHLLFYYSGHGTSAFDNGLHWLSPEIGPDSGGLATYDLSLADVASAVDTLVIGRRDLRPILSQVPPGAQALVVLDACYSENSAKSISIFRSAPIRGINLVEAIENQQPPAGQAAPPLISGGAAEGGAYPYTNVVSLSAASKDQPAIDINLTTMQSKPDWKTIDGKPHGALTNSLLEALSGRADTNHDGTISYDEMFRFVRLDMEKYPHQPQLLSAKAFSLDQAALGVGKSVQPTPPAPAPSGISHIRVGLQTADAQLDAKLRARNDIEIVTAGYDVVLRKEGGQWAIYDSSGVLIQSLPAQQLDVVVTRVQDQYQLIQLRRWSNSAQTFNVRIDAESEEATGYDKQRTIFHVGEKVRFRIGTERPAFLLLLGVDKDGQVTVLFPGPPASDRLAQAADKAIEFVAEATAPAGSELLKLVGFPRQPAQWADWSCSATACPTFKPGDPRMGQLMRLLQASEGASETSLRVITQQQ